MTRMPNKVYAYQDPYTGQWILSLGPVDGIMNAEYTLNNYGIAEVRVELTDAK